MSKAQYPIGIIGGSGLYQMHDFRLKRKVRLATPFGKPSDAYMVGQLAGSDVIFLPRHGVGHLLSPSEINFRANIWGFKKLGVQSIVSVSAVGSLKEEIAPGHMVIIDQFIDRTKARASTFFEKGLVAHVSFADPLCSSLREILISSANAAKAIVHGTGTYVCMEGPMFSTRAESHWYRSVNASVIGMTNLQEAKLAREAEMCYATIALSTDYDCWHDTHEDVTTDQIIAVLHSNVRMAQDIIKHAVTHRYPEDCRCRHSLAHAILTDRKKIGPAVKKKLGLLIKKYI